MDSLELSIDSASDIASIALSQEGELIAELTWQCGREHSKQLLPAIDRLLQSSEVTKDDLTAVFVSIGPGRYAGVRVGMSTAKGLAYGLEVPLVGVGRLETQAYGFASSDAPVAAVHRAGRPRIAWAVYTTRPDWQESIAPRMNELAEFVDEVPEGTLIVGEVDDELASELAERGHRIVRGAAAIRRAALLAELGWQRLEAGQTDDPKTLVPIYLREPVIGQKS